MQHSVWCLGYVKSIMGRRRFLPHVHSTDWGVRTQAERQAVNFVVQGTVETSEFYTVQLFKLSSFTWQVVHRNMENIELGYETHNRHPPAIIFTFWCLRYECHEFTTSVCDSGSAADLCKMAMIQICSHVSSSTTFTARYDNYNV